MTEEWFIALLEEQSRQDTIDRYERYSLPYSSATDMHGTYTAPELLSKKEIGRPNTDWRTVDKVLQIYDSSVEDVKEGKAIKTKSLRAIARELGNILGYVTIRNILREYRKDVYYNVKNIKYEL